MNKLWWSLPSPATFIEEVVSQIRRGNNTVLALPDHLPPGIEFACRAPLGLDWAWEHVEARPIDAPQRHIQSQYLSGNDVAPKHIAEKLATSRTHRNHIFWLHLTDPSDWLNWVDFVEEYSLVRESQGVRSAAQFVIILQGEAARKLPSEASGIVVRKWRNVISSVDALLHATHLYPKKGPYDIQDQLNIALCASVAMWDPDLAKTIMGDLDDFFKDPSTILRHLNQRRGWDAHTTPDWQNGQKGFYNGEERLHIGIHVARGVMGEFRRRQWEAQVGVLFPFIEQRRLQLIDLLSHSIPLPTSRSRNGFTQEITRPDELELSNMLDFLRSASGVESELIETVGKLKAMRDALAHQETVSNHEIAHPYAAIIRRARTEYSPTASIRRV